MATTPTIVVGRNNWGIKNGNLLGYYQSDDGFFVKREFAATRGGGTNGTFVGSNGLIQTAASGNLPRIDFTGGSPALLVEPAATNSIRNNSMVGAVTGTPGTLPTGGGWSSILIGLAQTIVGVGAENGISYIDIKFSGTATSTSALEIRYENTTQIDALNGQAWAHSVYLKKIADPNPPANYRLNIYERTSGGSYVANGESTIVPTTTIQRFTQTRTLSGGGTVAKVQPCLFCGVVSGSTYDFTVRIGLPQMELGSVATSVIPTTTSGLTRNADAISLTGATDYIGQTEGTIYAEVDMQKTGVINAIFALDVGSSSEYIALIRTSSNQFRASIKKSSGTQQNIINSSSYPIGVYKVAFAYKNGDYALYVNGVQAGTSTNATDYPTAALTQASVSSTAYGPFNDRIITAAIYNERLSDQELIEITS
jgi:hypothetical protein